MFENTANGIFITNGDVLSVDSGIIVHGCNCQGVMGAGVAASVKVRYPEAYAVYKEAERTKGLHLGDVSFVETHDSQGGENGKYIVNALTQHLAGVPGVEKYAAGRLTSYDAVTECFLKVKELALERGVNKIVFPAIGAGLGGGDWGIISSIIDSIIRHPIMTVLYVYQPR